MSRESPTRVLLLDRDWSQTGYLVASLRAAGMIVTLVSTRPDEPWGLGRYCRMIRPPGDIDDPQFLRQLMSTEPADLILPLCESTQIQLWTLCVESADKVHPRTTDFQREVLADRRAMHRYVLSQDVPAPEIRELSGEQSLALVSHDLGVPLVLRGTQGFAGGQVRVVSDLAAAKEAFQDLRERSPEPPFAQKYIVGRRCLIGGLFDQGRMLQWFSQTTVEATSATGPSIKVRSIRDPRLTSYAERLFGGLEWSGLACAEFIQDSNGEYYFLEVNPRPWAAIQAAHYCGVPLLDLLASYLKGKSIPAPIVFSPGKTVPLFPQFISARVQARTFAWRDLGDYARAFAGAPAEYPALLLHFLRTIWWQMRQ